MPYRSAERLRALISEYKRDADGMSDARLQTLIDDTYVIHQASSKDGEVPNPFVFFTSGLWLGLMDGRRNARQLTRAYEDRLRELQARQGMLEAERQRLDEAIDSPESPQGRISWWRRLWKVLGTFLGVSN